MLEFILAVGYLLWMLIKGIFKLIWWIISSPFKLKQYIDYKGQVEAEKQAEQQRQERKKQEVTAYKKAFAIKYAPLADKAYNALWYENGVYRAPQRLTVGHFDITAFYPDQSQKKCTGYSATEFEQYSSSYASDGSKSEDEINELLLLAEMINKKAANRYRLQSQGKRTTKVHISGDTQYIYVQDYVEMY